MNNSSLSPENLASQRHSLAHLLAAAVLDIYPDAKRTIGPAVDNGFYYDFEFMKPLSEGDLTAIENKMREILPTWSTFERKEVSAAEARTVFADNPYKLELIDEFSRDGQSLTLYTSGKYIDLCRGGHVENASEIDPQSFKLDRLAGAYWRGDEKNKMLTRIYGLAFASKAELDAYLVQREEAEKRDHKKLGRELQLFTFSPLVGSGLPLYMPKGNLVRETILKYITGLKVDHGYSFVWTPHLAKEALYVQSGHLGKYDAMLPPIETEEGERFVMKPMNCPHHFQIYKATPHSYRNLPFRIAENATDYRNEKSGELNGLLRVRSLTQDDTHHLVRHDQIASEIDMILEITKQVYETFGFVDFRCQISTRDPKHKDKYFGTDELWSVAEQALVAAVERWGAPHFIGEGDAAFYGPKIDIMVRDALGREWQLTTVQLDYVQPENFDMTYVAEDGTDARPAVLHVAILGSLDRFMAIVIEQYGGAFPLWLAPEQVRILPVSDKFAEYGGKVLTALKEAGLRVEMPEASETLGKRIREAEGMKIPCILVVGEKEAAAQTVTLRERGSADQISLPLAELVQQLSEKSRLRK